MRSLILPTSIRGGVIQVENPDAGGTISIGPVVLDLDGSGDLSYQEVEMDVNRDGSLNLTAWSGPEDGVLVWNKYADGSLRDKDQYAFTEFGGKTDLEGLAVGFDSNNDGVFDAKDADFAQFGVWQDANLSGQMDPGEFLSLESLGITAISLSSDGVEQTPYEGVYEFGRGNAIMADGSKMLLADVAFSYTVSTDDDQTVSNVI